MNTKIAIQNIYKNFSDNQVLKGINIDVNQGESLVILGGSGSGKSVLIKIIVGIISPTSGHVFIDGYNIAKLGNNEYNKLVRRIGFLFQGGALFDSLKIWENVSFIYLNNNEKTRKEAYNHAISKLERVGLDERTANLYPTQLSGGMQKRASLARTISLDPEIIFFDEPTTGLDPITSAVINKLIVSTSKDLGATTVTITHDMNSTKFIADNVAMLHKGQIIWHDKVDKLYKSGNEYVDKFVRGV